MNKQQTEYNIGRTIADIFMFNTKPEDLHRIIQTGKLPFGLRTQIASTAQTDAKPLLKEQELQQIIKQQTAAPADNTRINVKTRPEQPYYKGGGWYRTPNHEIKWLPGIQNQTDLNKKSLSGTYLGETYSIFNGLDNYFYNYNKDGKIEKTYTGSLKKEDYTLIKKIEDIRNLNAIEFLPFNVFFDFINDGYIFIRAFVGLPSQTIAGRGLSTKERAEAATRGMINIASLALPFKLPVSKGVTPETSFQQFSKLMKGKYSGQGYGNAQHMNIKWQDFKTNQLHLQLNTNQPFNEFSKIINYSNEALNDIKKREEMNAFVKAWEILKK